MDCKDCTKCTECERQLEIKRQRILERATQILILVLFLAIFALVDAVITNKVFLKTQEKINQSWIDAWTGYDHEFTRVEQDGEGVNVYQEGSGTITVPGK